MDKSRVQQARDILIEHMDVHRAECPDDDCAEVGNILAFLAHSLGARRQDLQRFPGLLIHYDMGCAGCGSARDKAAAGTECEEI